MIRIRIRLSAVAAALVVAAATPAAATASATNAPKPGDVLSSSPTSFHAVPLVPTFTRAWHITYASTTAKGTPNVVSGTVIVPDDGRTGTRPLLTYAVGTVGLPHQCAPSAGFPSGTTREGSLIDLAVQHGWAVVVTDYEGLGTPGDHTYTVGRAEGTAVLDAARAAQRLPGARAMGVTSDSPVGIMGYSQGGQASSWAAELHKSYAPELKVVGTATGGVLADMLKVADYNDGNIGGGLVLMVLAGHQAAHPELDLDKYLNDQGRFYVKFLRNNCVEIAVAATLFKRISDVTVANPLYQPDWLAALRADSLGSVAPDAPVYLYHAKNDEAVPHSVGVKLRSDWCAKGVSVQWTSLPVLEHFGGGYAGAAGALNWLADRFAGKGTNSNCG